MSGREPSQLVAGVHVQAALNGDREHPAAPRTPAELAAEARAAMSSGAGSVHLHPYGSDGRESLAPADVAAAIEAVRESCPGLPISLTTSADTVADPGRLRTLVAAWRVLPDMVTANQGEEGIGELCELLLGRGIGIEAGLLSVADAEAFVARGIADRCVRAMVEPVGADPDDALAEAAAIEEVLDAAGIDLPQIHHGDGLASWAVNRRALERGHGVRTGIEDTPVLPDGGYAAGNAELVEAAAELAREAAGL